MKTCTPIADFMFPQANQLYVETVTGRGPGDTVTASTLRPATAKDVRAAKRQRKLGKCTHSVVRDERGWMYDYRWCATCGAALGAI